MTHVNPLVSASHRTHLDLDEPHRPSPPLSTDEEEAIHEIPPVHHDEHPLPFQEDPDLPPPWSTEYGIFTTPSTCAFARAFGVKEPLHAILHRDVLGWCNPNRPTKWKSVQLTRKLCVIERPFYRNLSHAILVFRPCKDDRRKYRLTEDTAEGRVDLSTVESDVLHQIYSRAEGHKMVLQCSSALEQNKWVKMLKQACAAGVPTYDSAAFTLTRPGVHHRHWLPIYHRERAAVLETQLLKKPSLHGSHAAPNTREKVTQLLETALENPSWYRYTWMQYGLIDILQMDIETHTEDAPPPLHAAAYGKRVEGADGAHHGDINYWLEQELILKAALGA
ncbi:unnamed protein product [Vitrella brassicaformis CCMP3155]|uniref:PH domain-containing protein n=1 Tax=Vitrella brassicaformis (strain CCMP3155) TaxID=1169540 RepID=A0A0G4FYH3_VITBC|nr:unnamed protein product [Vitrella brassicaformis CCMP3155]|eukprot:CEM20405.1 unnamed protein product [Vitrella brassicaformis CCMP3155]